MAARKTNTEAEATESKEVVNTRSKSAEKKVDISEIDLNRKVPVFNIATHEVAYRKSGSNIGTRFSANATIHVRRDEILEQVQNGNRLYVGFGDGSHATLIIQDAETRKLVDFENDYVAEQNVVTPERVDKIFSLSDIKAFKQSIQDAVITRNEKMYLRKLIADSNYNEYDKIKFCEQYCKWHF